MPEDQILPFLNECLLVAELHRFEAVDLPTSVLLGLLNSHKPESFNHMDGLQGTSFVANAHDINPVFRIGRKDRKETSVFFGSAAVAIGVLGQDYGNWEQFKTRSRQLLQIVGKAYAGRPFTGFALKYVDVFKALPMPELEARLSWLGESQEPPEYRFGRQASETSTFELGGYTTTLTVHRECGRTQSADAETGVFDAMLHFVTHTDHPGILPTEVPESTQLETWLDECHAVHKRSLWRELTPSFRVGEAAHLFDDSEREEFDQ